MVKRWVVVLAAANLVLMATTAAFIHLWATLDQRSGAARSLIRHVLVQFHLATENVLAAWYSSMMLLSVAVLSAAAFAADRRTADPGRRPLAAGWLPFGAAFALLSVDEIGSLHERVGMLASAGRALGWVYLLAVPIAVVGLFMLAFAWMHLRRVPGVLALMSAGIALFLSNPVLEQIEMSIVHGENAADGTWQRLVHDSLLVIEEGVNELFGTLCFLAAVAIYVQHQSPERQEPLARSPFLRPAVLMAAGVVLAAGALVSPWVMSRLPRGDTGILAHWFPAAALFLFGCVGAAGRAKGDPPFTSRAALWLVASAIVLSAWFGSGLHGYTTWHRFDVVREIVRAALLAGFAASLSVVVTSVGWSAFSIAGLAAVTLAVGVNTPYAPAFASIGGMMCAASLFQLPPVQLPPSGGSSSNPPSNHDRN